MSRVSSFDLIDNSMQVKAAMHSQVIRALESIGQEAVGYAEDEVPVDTGRLRNSITHKVIDDENAVYIGTNVEYAPYVEFGTGKYAENGAGRKTPWAYQDDKGNWHTTSGMKPSHFLKKAAADHTDHYKAILKASLDA